MSQYDFALRDRLPELPSDEGGLVQVKYNGMLSVVVWDDRRGGFVAWSPRGRCYFSLDGPRKHPVTEYFNHHLNRFKDLVFIGETYVVRKIGEKCYMTEFSKSMSIIKNPTSTMDVNRIQLAVLDYAKKGKTGGFTKPTVEYCSRFKYLKDDLGFPKGCDSSVVHLPDYLEIKGIFQDSYTEIQEFWNNFISDRGFEGLVLYANSGKIYKVKFRDTLDAVIIAFRKAGNNRPVCEKCGARFDIFWLRKLAKSGIVKESEWFDQKGRLLNGKNDVWNENLDSCPICGGAVFNTPGPILGAKIALMTLDGNFLDISDGVQFSPLSQILEMVEPLYEKENYLWVKPRIVVEVSYQDLYIERLKPVYRYEKGRFVKVGLKKAVSFRPYKPRLREDKAVSPRDLRLEQLNYFVNRIKKIEEKEREAAKQKGLQKYLH